MIKDRKLGKVLKPPKKAGWSLKVESGNNQKATWKPGYDLCPKRNLDIPEFNLEKQKTNKKPTRASFWISNLSESFQWGQLWLFLKIKIHGACFNSDNQGSVPSTQIGSSPTAYN